jgi:hypothetical protein
LSESSAKSNLMEDFPPIFKKDPLEVQMHFITYHFETYGKVIRLEDVPEEMYGGALPVARSRKSKRKTITKDEYLEEAPEQPAKKAKKAKKEKAAGKMNVGGFGLPTIQEEVQDLNTNAVLNKRTRSGKVAASSQTAPEQPSIPKKKRKTAIRKLKESAYVAEVEEDIVATTELVTREVKKKKAEEAATLAKIKELAKGIEVYASSIAREDAGVVAHQLVEATEDLQELATSEAGNMLMIVNAGGDAQEGQAAGSDATAPEAVIGNLDPLHSHTVIEVESDSTPSVSS